MSSAVAFLLFICFTQIWAVPDTDTRIIDGELSSSGQFPYVAAIFYTRNGTTKVCGGSLINNRWILTAAFCVVNSTQFTIHLGTNNLEQIGSAGVIVDSTEYVAHPDYNSLSLVNNIGLISLPSAVKFSDYIQPVRLENRTLGAAEPSVAVGWGQTSDVSTLHSPVQYYVNLMTITNRDCMNPYGSYIRDSFVCAVGSGNKGICRGDSGGPLVQTDADGKPIQVGISIFYSGNGCELNHPSGFLRIADYLDWIESEAPPEGSSEAPPEGSSEAPSGGSTFNAHMFLPVLILTLILTFF